MRLSIFSPHVLRFSWSLPFRFSWDRPLQKKESPRPSFEPTTSSELAHKASTNPQDHDALTKSRQYLWIKLNQVLCRTIQIQINFLSRSLSLFYSNYHLLWHRDSTEVEWASQKQEVLRSNPALGEIFWIFSFSVSFFPLPGEELSFIYRETWIVFPLPGDLKSSILYNLGFKYMNRYYGIGRVVT